MMKAVLVLLLLGVICAFCETPVHPTPGNPGTAVSTIKKVHNRVKITFDGQESNGWLFDCQPSGQLEDSPSGCSAPHLFASNSTKAKQLCSRKCKLTPGLGAYLSLVEMKHKIHVEVVSYDQPHSHKAKCELKWSAGSYLAGYDLQIHYLWVDHIEVPFIEVKSCKAEAIESSVPLKSSDMFTDSRELVLDEKINFLATVLSLSLMALAMTMCCCACTFCATCLCFKICGKSQRQARREDVENVEMEQMPQAKSEQPAQVPVYIPYYMINPYSAPMFSAQQQGEQTFVMPNAPQQQL